MKQTKEIQYNELTEHYNCYGPVKLGLTTSHTYRLDPKRLTFLLSRYKFVSKIFDKLKNVLEVGCGDGFGSTLVASNVERYTGIDFDPIFIENVHEYRDELINRTFYVHDILASSINKNFDGIYSLDVLEHIDKKDENIFMLNIVNSLSSTGIAIIGMPSIESQDYASQQSKIGHINCKSGDELKELCNKFFNNVFIFSMNDEVVHTGFHKMAHYLLALCTYPKAELSYD